MLSCTITLCGIFNENKTRGDEKKMTDEVVRNYLNVRKGDILTSFPAITKLNPGHSMIVMENPYQVFSSSSISLIFKVMDGRTLLEFNERELREFPGRAYLERGNYSVMVELDTPEFKKVLAENPGVYQFLF